MMKVAGAVANSTQDSNGDWVQGTQDADIAEIRCRYETKDGNGYVTNESGVQIAYDAIVYMPLPVETIAIGAQVSIEDNGVPITKQEVKHFSRGQLNARVWL